MAYEGFKDLARRKTADNILHDKAFNMARNPTYDGYQRVLILIIHKFFDKNTSGSGAENEVMSDQ